ncbi:MAG: metallophosphoesterase [Candidatus Omnitrophota bacterium]
MLTVLFLLAAAALFIWIRFIEIRRYRVVFRSVPIRKKLPRPLKILHLSDFHFTGKPHPLDDFFGQLAREPYDLVFCTGDLIEHDGAVRQCAANLARLQSRYGIFAILGNHDHYDYRFWDSFLHDFPGWGLPKTLNDVDRLVHELKVSGIRVLRNETAEFVIEGVPFLVHGIDDPMTEKANLRATLENFDPRKVNILLTHSADVLLEVGDNEMDLALAGHTHGGQIRLPGIGPILTHTCLGRKYTTGLHLFRGTPLSVSQGMGHCRFLPFRWMCRPEAVVLEVRSD